MKTRATTALALVLCAYGITGCKKKTAAVTPPPAPAPVQAAAEAPRQAAPAPRRQERPVEAAAAPQRPQMPDAKTRARIEELLAKIQDAYFDYDKHTIRPDAEATLRADAGTLSDIIRQYPAFKLQVQGHCDERGSDEYNLALGDARAKTAKEYLVNLGLPAEQLNTVSYGKQKPTCTDASEDCYQKNRRAHLTTADNAGQ